MIANSVIANGNDNQLYYEILNGNAPLPLSAIEIEYQSENSSSLSYTDLSESSVGMDMSSPSTSSSSSCYPVSLSIENKLKDQLRFRYKSEKGNHGGLKPIIKLHNGENYKGIWIKVSVYTCGNNPTPHVLELEGKQCENGVCWKELSKDFTVKFPSLTISIKKKDEIVEVLKGRIKQNYKELKRRINEKDLEEEVQVKMKTFNLNSGMLYFQAFYSKNESLPVCEGIFSQSIYNQKCTLAGELKITRLSSFSGKASGNEDMILLCEKIRKEDIEIIFSCQTEDINWEERAQFNPADVHHQVAIPFKTPRFVENKDQEVSIRLCRKSDGKTGEPRAFLYRQCDDFECKPSKRKRPSPPDDAPVSMPEIHCESDTGTTSDDIIPQFPDLDSFLNYVVNRSDIDESEWGLPFGDVAHVDHVTLEGILNIATLNLGEKPSAQKHADQEQTATNTGSAKVEPVQVLKTGVINLLTGSEIFLRFLPSLLSIKDENSNTLLHLVIKEKSENLPLLIKMIEAAPNCLLNQSNKAKMTPLHIAISKRLWKVVRILLMSGANPDIKDKDGNTCTHLAALYSLPLCLSEILAPLISGHMKRKHRPDVNLLNYDGLTPLHLSVKNDSKFCVQLLIQAKADINIPDGKCGKTPLHFAYEKNSNLVNILCNQPEIALNIEDFNGNIPGSYMFKTHTNSTVTPKPTECCIELSTESSNSNEDYYTEIKEEKCNIFEKDNIKEEQVDENSEDLFCKTLDSNKLWKKLGLYILDEKEIKVIEVMDTTPTKTILNELKKQHGEKYPEKLKFILSDSELEGFAHLLKFNSK